MNTFWGILIPFFGTIIGAAAVFLMRNNLNSKIEKMLLGFASGVMVAASIWSLIIPSIEMSSNQDKIAWMPASIGFIIGILSLSLIDIIIPYFNCKSNKFSEENKLKKTTMMILAVTLHNIPEGMAVGVCFAGAMTQNTGVTLAGAFVLAIGIAIQNLPEGAIISMPLKSEGMSKTKAFLYGVLSGIVEPIGAVVTLLVTGEIEIFLPYLLAFAAGAMIYVVIEELIPESKSKGNFNIGTVGFTLGFLIMMILDVALG